jgi:ferric-dicitrate binding protein FerR (iron transport regulator)
MCRLGPNRYVAGDASATAALAGSVERMDTEPSTLRDWLREHPPHDSAFRQTIAVWRAVITRARTSCPPSASCSMSSRCS